MDEIIDERQEIPCQRMIRGASCEQSRACLIGESLPIRITPHLILDSQRDLGDRGMISINESFIEAAAPNAAAAKNGRGLVLKNKFVALHHSADKTLWFAKCQGSGETPYL